MRENLFAFDTCPLSRGNGELGADCGAQTSIDRTSYIGQQAEREFIFSSLVSVDASIDSKGQSGTLIQDRRSRER